MFERVRELKTLEMKEIKKSPNCNARHSIEFNQTPTYATGDMHHRTFFTQTEASGHR